MKHLLFFILFVAFSSQLSAISSQRTSCDGDVCPTTVDCCPLSVDYYEKQIHIADSLYKNYLPQYNFEEVKKAMEFFDSVQLSAVSVEDCLIRKLPMETD